MGSRTYSARVMRFRQSVYRNRANLSPTCQVLLLRLSDDMSANAIVSVPRSRLAEEFGCPPARITEWMKQARELGFLSIVRRGRPGVTAVYQGLVVHPHLVRPRVPSEPVEEPPAWYAQPDQAEVREGVPPESPTWYAQTPTQEGVGTAGNEPSPRGLVPQRSSNERNAS